MIFAFSVGIASAESLPNLPMGLYGDIFIGGSPAPADTRIEGKVVTEIDGKLVTQVVASTKVLNSGKYGDKNNYLGVYAPTKGTNVDIYVNDVKVATVAYTPGKSTKVDLNAPGTSGGTSGGTTGSSGNGVGGGGGVSGAGGTPKATVIQQSVSPKESISGTSATGTPVTTPDGEAPVFGWSTVLGVFGLLAIGAIIIFALKKMGKI